MSADQRAFQDHYPDALAHCYGCGTQNPDGLQLKSRWDATGEVTVAEFTPRPYHVAIPGYVYGGLIASLIDCHGTATAAAAGYRAEGRAMDSDPPLRYVTASLKVDFRRPTPLGPVLRLEGRVTEQTARKAVVAITLSAAGRVTAEGTVVAVRMPAGMLPADGG